MSAKEEFEENEELLNKNRSYSEFKKLRHRELLYQKAMLQRLEAKKRSYTWVLAALTAGLFSAIFSLVTVSLEDGRYIDKESLQRDIVTIVSNNGDLRAIKQSFANQSTISELKLILSSKSSYYPKTIALSSVLDDVRVQAFIKNEKELLPKLEPLIKEYEEINPFDKLQIGQKDYFENIRIKTEGTYPKIKNDINNLVDELHQKNLLVNEYLSDSKMSFWISIFAVFLSLMIGGYQIYSGRPEALRKTLIGLVDVSSEDEEQASNKKNQSDS
ncbi:hypothetical protein G8770_15950 [Aestuariicella hydrocarbonica]|uniref:Uncharacterized protein n=1 Tax=Pseudomaricurvus hydrocarbonicus TaxID=1470433 RepID=A0A9E5MMM8_9GAMM|nr:hypothetical protein [Aestuariicella hydrocarbonica]NHO67043.1 hypothetical protein [Aestuariicella hydrocarbonica]